MPSGSRIVRLHEGLVGLAADVGQHAAEQRVAQVAVLEGKPGRAGEQLARRDQGIERGRASCRAPGRPTDRRSRSPPMWLSRWRTVTGGLSRVAGGTDANCGTYSRQRRIEREPALVAQRQDRERRRCSWSSRRCGRRSPGSYGRPASTSARPSAVTWASRPPCTMPATMPGMLCCWAKAAQAASIWAKAVVMPCSLIHGSDHFLPRFRRGCRELSAHGESERSRGRAGGATTDDDALLSLLAAGLRLQADEALWRVSGNTLPHRTVAARSRRHLEPPRPVLGIRGRGPDGEARRGDRGDAARRRPQQRRPVDRRHRTITAIAADCASGC